MSHLGVNQLECRTGCTPKHRVGCTPTPEQPKHRIGCTPEHPKHRMDWALEHPEHQMGYAPDHPKVPSRLRSQAPWASYAQAPHVRAVYACTLSTPNAEWLSTRVPSAKRPSTQVPIAEWLSTRVLSVKHPSAEWPSTRVPSTNN